MSHSEAVHVETREPITPDAARALFAAVPGVVVRDDPAAHVYPLATEAAGSDEIYVGRVRTDPSIPGGRGLAFWVVSDNIRKGAASNAVEIAEVLVERGWVRAASRRARGGFARVTEADRRAALEAIAAEVRACTRCRLHEGRTLAVPGEGHPSTEVVFVGEGPGMNEDRQGRPFVGRAGDLLVQLLASIGWRRDDVFITNVVKCRPAGQSRSRAGRGRGLRTVPAAPARGPRSSPRGDPWPSLDGPLHARYDDQPRPRNRAAGRSRHGRRNAMVFAMYHPAAALRTPAIEQASYADMALVPAALDDARAGRSREPLPPTLRRHRLRTPPRTVRRPPASPRGRAPGRVSRPSRAGTTGRGPADPLPVTR